MGFLNNGNLHMLVGMFESAGYEIRIVGGAVRDHVRGIEPKDIDLCTNATPDQMVELAKRHNIYMIPTGLQHGTLTFVINSDAFEVTTLRVDVDTDGRHATVEFTTDFRQDAARRDLTFNAMSMDFRGKLFDYFGGEDDLKNDRIRFVGSAEQRVREDYLRVWRYFRFAAVMEYDTIPTPDKILFGKDFVREGLATISGERIWAELKKILRARTGIHILETAMNTAVFGSIVGDETDVGTREYLTIAHDLHNHVRTYRRLFETRPELENALVMAQLACLVKQEFRQAVIERLKFSTEDKVAFVRMGKWLDYAVHNRRQDPTRIEEMHRFRTGGKMDYLELAGWCISDISFGINTEARFSYMKLMKEDRVFRVTGQHLMDLGVKPGPSMGQILRLIRHDWAADPRATPVELAKYALRKFEDPSNVFAMAIKVYTERDFNLDPIKTRTEQEAAMVAMLEKLARITADHDDIEYRLVHFAPDQDAEAIVLFKDKATAMMRKLQYDLT